MLKFQPIPSPSTTNNATRTIYDSPVLCLIVLPCNVLSPYMVKLGAEDLCPEEPAVSDLSKNIKL